MAKVSKRGGFSDRNKIKPENREIQLKEFDKRTRIQLQNMISQFYQEIYGDEYYGGENIQEFFRYVIGTVYSEPVDTRRTYYDDDVLTLIEAIIQYWEDYRTDMQGVMYYNTCFEQYPIKSMYQAANDFFRDEYIGYRFVDDIIVPISDEYEVAEVNQALENPYSPVYEHISKANKLLADRSKPDYENSIKESISAVEALCEILTGITGKEASLGKMLKKLEDNGVVIHAGLKSAFNMLYGYTSDANGIRHAGDIGGPSSTFEEAKFMLVSCSAFVNYLIAVSAK